jgi:class 3 adenylate cyclase
VKLPPRLSHVAAELAKTRWATALCDAQWRLVWVSDELKQVLRETDEDRLGYGRHVLDAWMSDTWMGQVTPESIHAETITNIPLMVRDTPGGKEQLAEIISRAVGGRKEDFTPLLEPLEAVAPPPVWATSIELVQDELPPMRVNYVVIRIVEENSTELLGTIFLFGSGLPATVLTLLTRGDEEMFTRMARLMEPGRRAAAVLFADMQSSAAMSRRLPSAAYFKLMRAVTTAIDAVVIEHKGIVGKHAGDGVTAFFLAEDLGSRSAAARAAIAAGRKIGDVCQRIAKEMAEMEGLVGTEDAIVNVGVHWGGMLYMGQLVTGGRLEVTALGDRVNECARIQESARDGEVLASKSLLEHLTDDDARALGFHPDTVTYRPIDELPGVTDKARRDAGAIPVTPL